MVSSLPTAWKPKTMVFQQREDRIWWTDGINESLQNCNWQYQRILTIRIRKTDGFNESLQNCGWQYQRILTIPILHIPQCLVFSEKAIAYSTLLVVDTNRLHKKD